MYAPKQETRSMARQALPPFEAGQLKAVVDGPAARAVGMPHFSQRAALDARNAARAARVPSRTYVFVVISLAMFVIGLTFWCQPDIRHEVSGQLRVVSQPVANGAARLSGPQLAARQ